MSWSSELRRRSVFKVVAAYAVFAWLLVQVADVVSPALRMPTWTVGLVVVLAALGFPVAIVLAWVYELTPHGVRRTEPLRGEARHPKGYGIALGAVTVASIGVGIFAVQRYSMDPAPEVPDPPRPAVAVLPFDFSGGDSDSQILVDGLVEDLIARLSSWRSFPVIARAATFSSQLPSDIRAIGHYLDALYVVSGSVRFFDEQLRVTVELADASTGRGIWSQQYDRARGDVLALQNEITSQIVGNLNPALVDAESRRAVRSDPDNLDAWSAAHRGWWHVNREMQDSYVEARRWFERAIELDPNWGWPHAALALAHYRELLNGWSTSRPESVAALNEHAQLAVNLDPMDPFAHHALGHAYSTSGRPEESLTALARGVELNPSDAMASSCYGMQLAAVNRGAEAIEHASRAISLSPDDPWLHRFALVMARGYFSIADYPQSESWADRSHQLRPSAPALWHSASAAALAGDVERARRKVAEARASAPLASTEQIRRILSSAADPEYLDRLIEGLVLAGIDEDRTGG